MQKTTRIKTQHCSQWKKWQLLKRVKHTSCTRFSLLRNMTKLKCVVSALETITPGLPRFTFCLSQQIVRWLTTADSECLPAPASSPFQNKIRVIASRAIHGQAPAYISDLLNSDAARRSLRPSEQGLPPVLHASLKTNGAFEAVAPGLWMHCLLIWELRPQNLKCSWKTHLFRRAFHWPCCNSYFLFPCLSDLLLSVVILLRHFCFHSFRPLRQTLAW